MKKIGVIYLEQGKIGEAVEHFARALTLYQELGCSFESETAGVLEKLLTCCITELEHLANCYRLLGEDKKSAEYFSLAAQIRRKISEIFCLFSSSLNS